MFPKQFRTARAILRPVSEADAEPIFEGYAQDTDVTRYLTWRPHSTPQDTKDYIRKCAQSQSSCTYVIIDPVTEAVMGVFDLRNAGPAKLDFGYALARPYWGKGIMTDVLMTAADWALKQPGIWRIGAYADLENAGSIRVMEKAGFEREGTVRRWLIHPNISEHPRDCAVFSKTR